jgi:pilus assembly protein Flp/PilA
MFTSTIRRFLKDESGATMVEYGIMVAVIAAVAIAIVQSIGNKTASAFKNVDGAMP